MPGLGQLAHGQIFFAPHAVIVGQQLKIGPARPKARQKPGVFLDQRFAPANFFFPGGFLLLRVQAARQSRQAEACVPQCVFDGSGILFGAKHKHAGLLFAVAQNGQIQRYIGGKLDALQKRIGGMIARKASDESPRAGRARKIEGNLQPHPRAQRADLHLQLGNGGLGLTQLFFQLKDLGGLRRKLIPAGGALLQLAGDQRCAPLQGIQRPGFLRRITA